MSSRVFPRNAFSNLKVTQACFINSFFAIIHQPIYHNYNSVVSKLLILKVRKRTEFEIILPFIHLFIISILTSFLYEVKNKTEKKINVCKLTLKLTWGSTPSEAMNVSRNATSLWLVQRGASQTEEFNWTNWTHRGFDLLVVTVCYFCDLQAFLSQSRCTKTTELRSHSSN